MRISLRATCLTRPYGLGWQTKDGHGSHSLSHGSASPKGRCNETKLTGAAESDTPAPNIQGAERSVWCLSARRVLSEVPLRRTSLPADAADMHVLDAPATQPGKLGSPELPMLFATSPHQDSCSHLESLPVIESSSRPYTSPPSSPSSRPLPRPQPRQPTTSSSSRLDERAQRWRLKRQHADVASSSF